MRFIAIGIFLATLAATQALASESAGPDLARWISDNTDVPVSKVAIVEPDRIYSVERLGEPAPTGEVIALVRAERLKADWVGPQGYRSWDAHVIFDCSGGRLRVIRSASYPEPNRQGDPKAEARIEDWFTPRPEEPGARLLAAACEADFAWPLRPGLTMAAAAPPMQIAPVVERASLPAEQPTAFTPPHLELPPATSQRPVSETVAIHNVEKAPAAETAKRRFAGMLAPLGKVAAATGRLFAGGARSLRLAVSAPHHPTPGRQAALGEAASRKAANFARAGPGLE